MPKSSVSKLWLVCAAILMVVGPGCKQDYSVVADGGNMPNSEICGQFPQAKACSKKPMVTTPGVVTVLFTMMQIPQSAATLILANAIKYASPKENPKIVFLKDYATHGEDEGDPDYIRNTLLKGYDVTYDLILNGGLQPHQIAGADLVIISNPGYPLTDANTLAQLNQFPGGVILLGDDMAHGDGFSMDAFTGLTYGDNGTDVSCNSQHYRYDNLEGYNYQVSMNEEFLPGIPAKDKAYLYGNDIDHTTATASVQVLAWAKADPSTCDIGQIPAVVRRPK